MLPLNLLRTRTSRGKIEPLFCSFDVGEDSQYDLASTLITCFENTCKTGNAKKILLESISYLESKHDYKLVRGLSALLERRSIFENTFTKINPIKLRQKLFKESAIHGLALSYEKRNEIIQLIAKQVALSVSDVEIAMWSDQEENLKLIKFDSISPKNLLLWYNLSSIQTLLFRCITLEFNVQGGLYWKRILRNVKKYGLMYNLEHDISDNSDSITCTLEGPLSLFKMTDRYGTSMAKLLPWIIQAPSWNIRGSIVRKNDEGQKLYQFKMSEKDAVGIIPSESERLFLNYNATLNATNTDNFDSSLEIKFEKLFQQYFDKKDDWKISREPDPLIADGKAMIPDFLFERFGRKVYFEIVGFWTKEYLERKTAKIKSIFEKNTGMKHNVDLLVGVNADLACSPLESASTTNVFTFKKEISLKPILTYLKKIDQEILDEKTRVTTIKLEKESEIISIDILASKYKIPIKSALEILRTNYPEYVFVGDSHMFSDAKINAIKESLDGTVKFTDACKILDMYDVPEICQADLLSTIEYDVIWNDLDPSNATIVNKNKF